MRILTTFERKAIRKSANVAMTNMPIEIIEGIALAPRVTGEPGHYETKTGILIRHPSAYSRKGWKTMMYKSSTRHIEVGSLWVESIVGGDMWADSIVKSCRDRGSVCDHDYIRNNTIELLASDRWGR